jgi:hypothetical protein
VVKRRISRGGNPCSSASEDIECSHGALSPCLCGSAPTKPLRPALGLELAETVGRFVVTFATALAGKGYRLERKDALTDPTWGSINGVSDFTPAFTGSAQITDPAGASVSKHFYRVRVLP